MFVCCMTRAATRRFSIAASTAALLLASIINFPATTTALPFSSTTTSADTTNLVHYSPFFHPGGGDNNDENDDYPRLDDRLRRRDFIWRNAHHGPQKWCGSSSRIFSSPNVYHEEASSSSSSSSSNSNRYYDDDGGGDDRDSNPGPSAWDCQTFVRSSLAKNGTWFVENFGIRGDEWVEFARVQSCKVAVRHSDGGRGTVPIGNQDAIDLLTDIMALHAGAETLPTTTEGNMTCERRHTSAAVEWKVYAYGSQASEAAAAP